MKTILIATDSFKDALPALDACRAIERGIRLALPAARTIVFPLGDGGEGTAAILTHHAGGRMVQARVKDPLFRTVEASYGLSSDGLTAYIEMAQASGIQLLQPSERNPLYTSSFGTGELILDAISRGARRIILCIGGSATHDCGAGMAEALGYVFLDAGAQPVSPTGGNLTRIAHMDAAALRFDPGAIAVEVLCDVNNPLCGPSGAAHTFARQKGADEHAVIRLEEGARHFAVLLQEHLGKEVADVPGAGAAGGLGAGAIAFLRAQLLPGTDTVLRLTGFQAALEGADCLITGEGRLDNQTMHGKLIAGIARRAFEYGIPVFALCGTLQLAEMDINALGLTAAFSIIRRPCTLQEAIAHTRQDIEHAACNLLHTLQAYPLMHSHVEKQDAQLLLLPPPGKADFPLTKREREVVQLIAKGKNNRQIAQALFISNQTVGVHRKNIMRKLGVNNVAALLKKGYDAGIFS